MATLGSPAVSTPNQLALRPIQDAVSNIRQRLQAIETLVTALENAGSTASLASAVAKLQAEVDNLTAGTFESITLAVPDYMSVTPVNIQGNWTYTFAFNPQDPGFVFAGPVDPVGSSGNNATPSFRALDWYYDIPPFTTMLYTTGLVNGDIIAVERYGQMGWTTLGEVVELAFKGPEPANTGLFGPTSGAAAPPTFRTAVLADLPAGVALTGSANVFTKAQAVTPVALTDASSIATDASLSNVFTVTIAGNRTLANPTNLTDGAIYNWFVTQGSGGNHTLNYGGDFKWPGGTAPVLSTAAGAVDLIVGQYLAGAGIIAANFLLNFH